MASSQEEKICLLCHSSNSNNLYEVTICTCKNIYACEECLNRYILSNNNRYLCLVCKKNHPVQFQQENVKKYYFRRPEFTKYGNYLYDNVESNPDCILCSYYWIVPVLMIISFGFVWWIYNITKNHSDRKDDPWRKSYLTYLILAPILYVFYPLITDFYTQTIPFMKSIDLEKYLPFCNWGCDPTNMYVGKRNQINSCYRIVYADSILAFRNDEAHGNAILYKPTGKIIWTIFLNLIITFGMFGSNIYVTYLYYKEDSYSYKYPSIINGCVFGIFLIIYVFIPIIYFLSLLMIELTRYLFKCLCCCWCESRTENRVLINSLQNHPPKNYNTDVDIKPQDIV